MITVEVKKENVKKAYESGSDAVKTVLKTLFPSILVEEWVDITDKVKYCSGSFYDTEKGFYIISMHNVDVEILTGASEDFSCRMRIVGGIATQDYKVKNGHFYRRTRVR